MTRIYEWIVEEVDDEENIIDTCAWDTPEHMFKWMRRRLPLKHHYAYGLTREIWDATDGLIDRMWAYIDNGVLPEMFSDSAGIPRVKIPNYLRQRLTKAQLEQLK